MPLSMPLRRRGLNSSRLPTRSPDPTFTTEKDHSAGKIRARPAVMMTLTFVSILAVVGTIILPSNEALSMRKPSHGRSLPRVVVLFSETSTQKSHHRRHKRYSASSSIKYPMSSPERQDALLDSDDYDHRADEWTDDTCKAHYPWQTTHFPSCQLILEQEFLDGGRIVANGHWRDVWIMPDWPQSHVVLKTMRYEHDVTDRNLDRHRRDAVAMERLTGSPWIMDIYGHCGNSGLFEFAPGGDLEGHLMKSWYDRKGKPSKTSSLDKLLLSTQIALAVADVHTVEDSPSLAHADISLSQWVKKTAKNDKSLFFFKLNDFNRARFLAWNSKKKRVCPYEVGKNPGKFRSPEEYAYDKQTEKVDVYSLGNVLYTILVQHHVWEALTTKEAQKMVKKGHVPPIPEDLLQKARQEDKNLGAILKAMAMCHETDPYKRASARSVAEVLQARLDEVDPGRLEKTLAAVRTS